MMPLTTHAMRKLNELTTKKLLLPVWLTGMVICSPTFATENLIHLSNHDINREVITYEDTYIIGDIVTCESGVSSILINGEEQIGSDNDGAMAFELNAPLPLDKGKNEFTIAVTDREGHQQTFTRTIYRSEPDYALDEHRFSITALPLNGNLEASDLSYYQQLIEQHLLRDPIRFNLIQPESSWDALFREHNLSQSDLGDDTITLKVGQLTPSDLILTGNILNNDDKELVYLRIMDRKGNVICTARAIVTDEMQRPFGINQAMLTLKQYFPLIEGTVTQIKGKTISIDQGSEQGVTIDTVFVVMSSNGEIIMKKGKPLTLSVVQVFNGSCRTHVDGSRSDLLAKGQKVFAR